MTTATKPKRGRKPLTEARPCVRCGDLGGRTHRKGTTPERLNGEVFGVRGKLCRKCYEHLRNLHLKAQGRGHRKIETPRSKPRPPGPVIETTPCADCGTTEGRVRAGCVTPARHRGESFGVSGILCARCYHRAYDRKQRAEAMALAEEVGEATEIRRRLNMEKRRGYVLPVLTPSFTRDDLSPRAEARLLIREAKKGGRL